MHCVGKMASPIVWIYICVAWWTLCVRASVEDDAVNCPPQHVHLSLSDTPSHVTVTWATKSPCDTEVTYGTSPWQLDHNVTGVRVVNYTENNSQGLHYIHRAVLTDLSNGTTYYYRPSSNNIGRGPFYFKTPDFGTDWSPQLLVVGDLGPHSELLPLLSEEALSGQYNAMLQLGGLSDYFADSTGTRGDTLLKGLEHLAAFIPYMTAPGHNETSSGQHPGYRNRFSMPNTAWPMPQTQLWYSFNLGPAHFISYDTDVYLRGSLDSQNAQNQWLVKDLSQANADRSLRPWIVAFGRHPLYCDTGLLSHDCALNHSLVRAGLEEKLFYYGVDLILQSHPQGYERLYPMFKGVVLSNNYTSPRAPIHITIGTAAANTTSASPPTSAVPATVKVTTAAVATATETGGAGGNGTNSGESSSSNSSTSTVTENGGGSADGVDSKEGAQPQQHAWTAVKLEKGTQLTYGRLHIINATHLHWQLLAGSDAGPENGSGKKEKEVLDSVWIVQEKHGKFQLSDLPEDVGKKIDETLVANGGQPGVLHVTDPEKDTASMLSADDTRRLIIGASFGGFVALIIFIIIVVKVKRRVKRRSVRRWDVMDYKYGKTKLYSPADDEDDEDDDFHDDNDFEVDIPDGKMQTKKLINGK